MEIVREQFVGHDDKGGGLGDMSDVGPIGEISPERSKRALKRLRKKTKQAEAQSDKRSRTEDAHGAVDGLQVFRKKRKGAKKK